jgi:hypothetical protein
MTFVVEECPFYDCRFYFCPTLHPDFEVIGNLLLPILIIITKSFVLTWYLLTNISLVFMVQQCELGDGNGEIGLPARRPSWTSPQPELAPLLMISAAGIMKR